MLRVCQHCQEGKWRTLADPTAHKIDVEVHLAMRSNGVDM